LCLMTLFIKIIIFIYSNDNRNRHTHTIDWIKSKEKIYIVRLHLLEILSKNKYFYF